MSDQLLIPVYGSVKELRLTISQYSNDIGYEVKALTPFQVMLSEHNPNLHFSDETEITNDVCFIVAPHDLSEDDQGTLLTLLKVSSAPIAVSGVEQEDEEVDVLQELNNDLREDNGLAVVERFHRYQDTLSRVFRYEEDHDNKPIIVPSRGKIISQMMPEGIERVLFFIQNPILHLEDQNDPFPNVIPDPDEPISDFFSITRVGAGEDGELRMDPYSDDILVSNPSALVYIESMTNSIITTLYHNRETDRFIGRSWVINDDSIDGMSHIIPRSALANINSDYRDALGIDMEEVEYFWPESIDVTQMSILSPVYSEEQTMALVELLNDIEE